MTAFSLRAPPTFRRFAADCSATAAIEFALILPFLIVLMLGFVDLTDGVNARRKVTLAAGTVSDLVARVKDVDAGYANSVLSAGAAIMAPLDTAGLGIVVSSIVTDATGRSTVAWSIGRQKTARAAGSTYFLPAALRPSAGKTGAVVMAEVAYTYKPLLSSEFLSELRMAEITFAQPRVAQAGVTCSATGC
jgi:Flp pilus assembly protein TadG